MNRMHSGSVGLARRRALERAGTILRHDPPGAGSHTNGEWRGRIERMSIGFDQMGWVEREPATAERAAARS